MKKILLLLAAAAPLFLAARPIDNCRNPDGTPVLIPTPQRYEARTGTLELPAEFTVSAPKEAANEVERFRRLAGRCFPQRAVRQVDKDAFLRLELATEGLPESPEAYTLEVGAGAVTIRARTTHGLFHGVNTLGNLLRNAEKAQLDRCLITDWPDTRTRGVYFERRITVGHRNMPILLKLFDFFGELKYNAILLEFGEYFPYKENPFTLRKTAFLPEDIEALKAAAKRNHLEIIPYLKILSHDQWMHAHPRYHEEISEGTPPESAWSSASCPLKPLPRKIFKMAIKEHIEAFSPRRFMIGLDEIAQCPWGICELCRKHSRFELLKMAALEYTGEVLKYGVAPIVDHDQFFPGLPMQGEKILPEFDRRVTINIWNYADVVRPALFDFFSKTGLPIIAQSATSNINNLRSMPRIMKKYGVDTVFLSNWGTWYIDQPKQINPPGLAGFADGGNYAWNISDIPPAGQNFDPAVETRRLYTPEAVIEPRDYSYAPLPLDAVFNAKLGRERAFPLTDAKTAARLKRELAAAREHFRFAVAPDGGYFAVKAGKTEGETPKIDIALPGNGVRAEVLSFLLAAGLGAEPPGTHQRTEIGALSVGYADGKTQKIPLALLITVNHWNVFASGYRIRFVNRFNDTRGALAGLFALDWKNPRPKTPITSISLEANGALGMPIALFAVSAGRRPAGIVAKAARCGDDDAVAARLTEWSRGLHERNAAIDTSGDVTIFPLENGIPANAKFALSGKSVGRMVKTVVDDPAAPTPGKVLRLDIPATREGETERQRLTIDIWFDFGKLPSEVKTLIFDYKYASNALIFIPACYLSASTSQSLRKIPFSDPLAPEGKWYTVKIPVDKMRREGGKFKLPEANRVRLSIFFHTHPEPTTVWFGPVRASTVRQQTPPMLRIEKVPEVNEEIPPPTQVAL